MKRVLSLFAALLVAAGLFAQNVIPGGKEVIKIEGYVSATAFFQNQTFEFGNGQEAEWATPPEYTTNKWFSGMDVRNTTLRLLFNDKNKDGHKWHFGGALEMDFFGGYVGASLFSAQMPVPRLVIAYMDMVHNNIRIRVGQAYTPLVGNIPVSLSHLGFPLGAGATGWVGWRLPGVYLYWGLNGAESAVKLRLDAALFTGSWQGPGSTTNFLTAGNFGTPQMELKLNFNAKKWSAYVVGHFDKKNMSPVNVPKDSTLTGLAAEFGAKFHSGGFMIQGNFYTGKNIGQEFGQMTQVQQVAHDLSSYGGWMQVGYEIKKFGIYAFFGSEKVDHDDAVACFSSPRTNQQLYNFMLKYAISHQTSVGMEWLHSDLTYGKTDTDIQGDQISFSVLYEF